MRYGQTIIGLVLLCAFGFAHAAEGLITLESEHGVERTMNRLERAVRVAGFRVFARIDHARAADRVNIRLRPTEVLIFGKPKAGSLLMDKGQSIGIDLPLKYLVWLDEANEVRIGWNDPRYLAERHAIEGVDGLLRNIEGVLQKMAEEAARR
jgi:uncharacterized protein (DUF302 family)